MNQAMSRQLRMRPLLLLVPLLMASAPPSRQAAASTVLPVLKTFRIEFQSPPIAGSWTRFTITAIDDENNVFTNYLGTVNVTVSGTQAGADVDPESHVFLGLGSDNGVAHFRALWLRSGPQAVNVADTLGSVNVEHRLTVLPGAATRFDLQLPQMTQAGAPVSAHVTAYDAQNNVATGFTGTIRFGTSDPMATVPGSYTFQSTDGGQKTFSPLVFRKAGPQTLTVTDTNTSNPITPVTRSTTVAAGPTKFFRIKASTRPATAGERFDVTLEATDEFGNVKPYNDAVQFSSSDARAVLPSSNLAGTGPFPVTFRTAGTQSLTVTGVNSISGQLTNFTVLPGSYFEVLLSTPNVQPVDACTPAAVQLQAVDEFGNPVPDDARVTLCGVPRQGLSVTGHTLTDANLETPGCIEGELSDSGQGRVSWSNTQSTSVVFGVVQATLRTATLTWQPGGFSPEHSSFSFPNAAETPPRLRTFSQELAVQFNPRNACGEAVDFPQGQVLSFQVQSPLFLSAQPRSEGLGRWSSTVRLPKCPDTGATALKLWPALNNEPIRLPNGEPLRTELLPNCLPPDVQLAIHSVPKDSRAMPGAQVEFKVELSNTGTNVIPAGLLYLETEALTGLEVRLDDEPLGAFSTKLELPELGPGETRTVKLQGQASVEPEPGVKLTAWYTTVGGAALTEKQALSLEWEELGADVGCACQAGSLPSQFLPWLALLAAASRSRSRLRRLARDERIDR